LFGRLTLLALYVVALPIVTVCLWIFQYGKLRIALLTDVESHNLFCRDCLLLRVLQCVITFFLLPVIERVTFNQESRIGTFFL